jgi:hypothetical protein
MKLSFLQISPKVWSDQNHLYAKTSKFFRFLNLFSYSRTVIVDRIKKHIEIKIKYFWFITSKKQIAFNDIKTIDIEKSGGNNRIGLIESTYDSETYYVQVNRESSPYPENIFRFVGGYKSNFLGDFRFFDIDGMQYEKALSYAELISKYTESPLKKDRKIELNINVDHYRCLKCGHVGNSKTKCVYCGGGEMESMS